ncbi:hypothetical protein FACS189485_23190 [Spirochaetia bacterium]|nr:hypothetical protein FACS189485_23190 [Spirochaetia bacterium]
MAQEIALKIDNLEKKNEDFKELSRKIDKLSEGFFELKGGIDTNFKMYDTKFDKLEKTIEDLEPTISALKKYLKDKNYL